MEIVANQDELLAPRKEINLIFLTAVDFLGRDGDLLTSEKWKVILYINEYYTRVGIAPFKNFIRIALGFTPSDIMRMFSDGYHGACRAAGLPKNKCRCF